MTFLVAGHKTTEVLKHICCLDVHSFLLEAGPPQAEESFAAGVRGNKGGKHRLIYIFALPHTRIFPNTVSIFAASLVLM